MNIRSLNYLFNLTVDLHKTIYVVSVVFLSMVSGLHAQMGNAVEGQQKAISCSACHGTDGNSMMGDWPSLAGQHESYLITQITAMRDGQRVNLLMAAFVIGLSDEDINDIASYYASQTLQTKTTASRFVAQGQNIYLSGDPSSNLPACTSCHGPDGKGNPFSGYPSLAGQHASYTQTQLNAYANGTRKTIGNIEIMHDIASLLSSEEIEAVSNFVQGLR